ncbi:cell division protein FtsQ/DivIB [Aestuariimicrobium ganziense]|uniref:cell division protein FtsQ/DivIB n=1 Tax=Aestuariimicrobium ganziense TaxID=2773677 RepID=UPI00194535D1|nr:FtsQ-type POTRA domain-containing protein [Aestuariimicrobium ganziense]
MASRGSVADATGRLKQRASRRRRQQLVGLAWLLGVVVLLSGLAYLFFASPAFVPRQVRVDGVSLLTVDQVRAKAAVPRMPLARIDTGQIAERVATMPEVGSVRVRVRYPSTVVIEVVERTPVVQRLEGSSFQWVDAEGVVFHSRTARLPNVVAVKTPSVDTRLLKDAGVVARSLTPQLKKRVVRIEADTPDAFTLVLDKNQKVVWGSAADSETKSQVATALLTVKATVYDVSSPSTPTSR